MSKQKLMVGIDLGTTNSECFVSCDGGPIEMVYFKEGDRYKPGMLASIVKYDEGHFVVGNKLKEDDYQFKLSWKYLKPKMMLNSKRYDVGGKETTKPFPESIDPVEFSEQVLKTIYTNIKERFPDSEIINLIITVPAYFKDLQRRNVIAAAKNAGFTPKGEFSLVNEPTAAALAYGERLKDDQKIIAYDLGGGTFDVTLLDYECVDGFRFYQAVATDGKEIGGKDFDEKIVQIVYDEFIKNDGKQYAGNSEFKEDFYRTFMLEAEKIKIALNSMDEMSGYKLVNYNGERVVVQYCVRGEDFYNAISPLVTKTIEMTKKVMGANDVSRLLLVGGSTRMPYIRNCLKEAFPKISIASDDPDLIVAKGACIHSKALSEKEDSSLMLNEITSNAVGLSVSGGFVSKMIYENTPIPYTITERFYGVTENQKEAQGYIVVGKDICLESRDNQIIGAIEMSNLIETGEKPAFDITVTINADSTVDVVAKEVAVGGQEIFKRFDISDQMENEQAKTYKDLCDSAEEMFKNKTYDELKGVADELIKQFDNNTDKDEKIGYLIRELKTAINLRAIKRIKTCLFRFLLVIR